MKHFLLWLLLLLTLPSHAVLKERDLARTLGVLSSELRQTRREQLEGAIRAEQHNRLQRQQFMGYMQRAEQISLMLYSQQEEFTFDMAYACQAATELYQQLQGKILPYAKIRERVQLDIDRYAQLIVSLEHLPPTVKPLAPHHTTSRPRAVSSTSTEHDLTKFRPVARTYQLSPAEQRDRDYCLQLAREIHTTLKTVRSRVDADARYYESVRRKVESLNRYANARYDALQKSIFFNATDNYFRVLSKFPYLWSEMQKDLSDKYASPEGRPKTYSEWRGPVVEFMIVFMLGYALVTVLLSNIALRFAPQRWLPRDFAEKRRSYFTAAGLFLFAISIVVLRMVVDRSFILMAAELMSNMAWLALAVMISLLLRLDAKQLPHGVRLYLPFVTMAFIVVALRVLFVPNALVILLYPPLLLLFTLWQMHSLRRPKKSIPTTDLVYAAIAMIAMCVATAMAWMGFVLLAVQVMVWWMFQLAAVQTIAAAYDLLATYEAKRILQRLRRELPPATNTISDADLRQAARDGVYIHRTWLFDLAQRALVPVGAVASVVLCIWYASGMFEMQVAVKEIFAYNFIDEHGLIQVSLHKLVLVIGFWFVFRYVNYVSRSFYHYVKRLKTPTELHSYNVTLVNNVISILVWGSYFLYALVLLQVPKTGISVVTAGLATGMGFATKDLLENFVYGISLMTGRLRVGDVIECDGIQGRVESMSYQSTQIVTFDGSVIAFLNTQLFNKNFKNLTRNNAYELAKIPFGIAYGARVDEVRALVIAALTPLNERQADGRMTFKEGSEVGVVFSDFGDSSLNLTATMWVLVERRAAIMAQGREIIYNTLNAHNIEIPFPQLDVRMRDEA